MNFSVRELESLRPRLRDGLHFTVQEHGGERVCVMEDPAASRFFRVGFEEYRFFRSLDGSQPVAVLLARLARDAGGESFSEAEAMQLLRWLNDNHLLAVESDRKDTGAGAGQRAWKAAVTWLNPLLLRVPMGRPDRFFAWLAGALRPLLGGFGFLIWLGVVLAGAAQLAVEWPRFRNGFEGILASDNWLWLIVVWLGLKVFHECGHGVYCRHFGAKVREVGAIFVLFLPMGYVDATASLGLASRWKRIAIASAGVYVELLLAAIAALVWVRTPDGPLATILHNAIVMGSIVTIFFNANPLMRFDGYYVLSDLLGIPNLATRARAWLMRAFGWLLLGAKSLRPGRPQSRREWFISTYAVAAWVWQWVVMLGLLFAASALFRGGGAILAVMAGVLWLAAPLWMMVREFGGWLRSGTGKRGKLLARGGVALAVLGAVLLVPYHKTVVAAGVVEFGDTRVLRAECPGFAEKIHVRDGEVVEEGALLVELRNEEAAAELRRARIGLEAQRMRARLAYTRGEVAEHQAEQARVEALEKAVQQREKYVGTLQVRAPRAGRVTGRALERSQGVYFPAGSEILRLGEAQGREVKLAVGQDAEAHFRAASGQPVQVRVEGRGTVLAATLERLDDQASMQAPHPALMALSGGPLPVRRTEGQQEGQAPYELAEAHFEATVRVNGDAAGLADGELARVKFESPRRVNLLGEMRGVFARWVRGFGG